MKRRSARSIPRQSNHAEAWAEYYGIPFREPPSHNFDFKLLVRAVAAAKGLSAVHVLHLAFDLGGSGAWPLDRVLCIQLATEMGLPACRFFPRYSPPR